ncbi:LAQU0S10e02872g1_1 [Lachancea quebecensis]|uniref:LAQU0S10e02872g1_1 n=1 Tax=Lachancea quebecensis TaxID=1654605 RepID=A0A0P1KU97_9SACH|nr:LAQU0S10e02872g1_1 [Lachancea quebecensis]
MAELDTYIPMIDAILSVSDPDEVSAKRIRRAIQELFAVDLEPVRKKINALIVERFNHLQDARVEVSQDELAEDDAKVAKTLAKKVNGKAKKENKGTKVKKKRKVSESSNSLNQKKMQLSDDLQKLVGEPELARTQVVKKVWEHIKDKDLQNPQDRREILCDELMKPIFGDKTTMFALNKSLSKHIYSRDEKAQAVKPAEGPSTTEDPAV